MPTPDAPTLSAGSNLLLRLPQSTGHPVLHIGEVCDANENRCTVQFEAIELTGDSLDAEVGQDVLVFFEGGAGFMQQSARVTAIPESPIPALEIETRGQPVSAESRQQPRISMVATDVTATLGEEEQCPLLDVSPTGFAVMTNDPQEVGAVLDVTMQYQGKTCRGEACIQSAREVWPGRYRVGLHVIDESDERDESDESDDDGTLAVGIRLIHAEHVGADR